MIGFIGGTGSQGRSLALRFAAKGYHVLLGSRSREKAERIVKVIESSGRGLEIRPGTNEEAAGEGEIVFITLPYRHVAKVVEPLRGMLSGKIVVDVVNPFAHSFERRAISASEELQNLLPQSKVVCAFKNVSSKMLWRIEEPVEAHSLVCSDHADARRRVMELSEIIGVPAVDIGGLENAFVSELLTMLLLRLNRLYGAETGVRMVFSRP